MESVVLWNQVGGLQRQLSGAHSQIRKLEGQVEQFKKREAEARRVDTSPKKEEWLFPHRLDLYPRPPKGYEKDYLRTLWDNSYGPRKGQVYDVAYVEWRASGRTRREKGEELAEVLWVVAVINSSKALGYNMTIDLEFLDEKGFRIAQDQGRGYIFLMEGDEVLPRITKLRGGFWAPVGLVKEIRNVTGVWRARVGF